MNPDYYIKKYAPDTMKDWNIIYNSSDEIGVYYDARLSEIYAKRRKAQNESFIVYFPDKTPAAICSLYFYVYDWRKFYRRNERTVESFFLSGPALANGLGEKKRRDIIYYIGMEIEKIILRLKADKCTVSTDPLCKRYIEINYSYTNPLHEFRGKWENIPIPYYYFDLTVTEEELLKNMEVRARSILKKAAEEKLFDVKIVQNSDMDNIWRLFIDTQKRVNMPYHPREELEWFLNYEYSTFYLATINNKPACAINIAVFRNTAQYWLSYTATEFMHTEVATYLLWHAIKEAKKNGVIHFNIGDQPFAAHGSKEDAIAKFKRSFGGELRYRFEMRYRRKTKLQTALYYIAERI